MPYTTIVIVPVWYLLIFIKTIFSRLYGVIGTVMVFLFVHCPLPDRVFHKIFPKPIFEDLRPRGQGLDLRGQGQGLQNVSSRTSSRTPPLAMMTRNCKLLKGGCSLAKYDIKKSHLIFWSQSKKKFFRRLSSFWKNQKNPFQLRTLELDWLTIWWRTSWLAKKQRKLVHNGKQ